MTTFRTALSDAWFVTTVTRAWLARQDEKAASALGGDDL